MDASRQVSTFEPRTAELMLPLTSTATMMDWPVGVMVPYDSRNSWVNAFEMKEFGTHEREPRSPCPFLYTFEATRTLMG